MLLVRVGLGRGLIVADTNDGLAAAGARGRVSGRRPKFSPAQAALAQRLYDEREKAVQQLVDMFGVPRSTGYGNVDREKTVPRQPMSLPRLRRDRRARSTTKVSSDARCLLRGDAAQ
ncbi:hypothetical protein [Streptomyces sp. KR55]|uniref:hypothetical protein n=1 Tax=Streptomyces sp. KR55 TaxID=3457425 RepID=UPI003FD202B3